MGFQSSTYLRAASERRKLACFGMEMGSERSQCSGPIEEICEETSGVEETIGLDSHTSPTP
jgi:hypothetical protein